jgi:predicted RNA-binding protein associated with RNAse of E/G family
VGMWVCRYMGMWVSSRGNYLDLEGRCLSKAEIQDVDELA